MDWEHTGANRKIIECHFRPDIMLMSRLLLSQFRQARQNDGRDHLPLPLKIRRIRIKPPQSPPGEMFGQRIVKFV